MAFTYSTMPNGKYTIKANTDDNEPKNTNAENVEELYFDASNQFIYHHTGKPMLMGKYVIQHSFELLKRK
jgi:hypothetical protein